MWFSCLSAESTYRVCHGFRLMKQDDYFKSLLTTFEVSVIFEAAGSV